ncbi:MAG: dethiobiotin synthase [Verrucomicrobiae bacterium]|nr:dethiobiotin synthase [Verrucomicrobiae bacterium]
MKSASFFRSRTIQTLARSLIRSGKNESSVFFVTATDTGTGKTWVSEALLREWRRCGIRALGVKAISCGGRDDARRLVRAGAPGWTLADADPVPLPRPMAPAAQHHPSWSEIVRRVRRSVRAAHAAGARAVLVEGAGGLLCPVDGCRTMRELASALGAPLLVVAPNRLGVLNQALLVLEAAQTKRLRVVALVLNRGLSARRSKDGADLRQSNARLLRRLAGTPVREIG